MPSDVVVRDTAPRTRETVEFAISPAHALLQQLLSSSIVVEEDWERLPAAAREELSGCAQPKELLPALTGHGLITPYQAGRIQTGYTSGLVLGNYRILDRLGAGGMSVVYKAEQLALRRSVAIKVLAESSGDNSRSSARFTTEMRAVAQLQHPNIVAAIDAGTHVSSEPHEPPVRYFVMEYVPGQDLEQCVADHGPLPVYRACDLIHQVASALEAAHARDLVHRDIKPSNIRVTPEGQAKLLDFGLARRWDSRHTRPGTFLGTVDFMAPEQANDAGSVDIRADIFALGATLYLCLTGQLPFRAEGTRLEVLLRRMTQPPPSARAVCLSLSPDLDNVLTRMMAVKPADRYPTPRAVMRALVPFLKSDPDELPASYARDPQQVDPSNSTSVERTYQVLIVDDNSQLRELCRRALQSKEIHCSEAASGPECLEAFRARSYDLVLLDIDMPEMTGPETLRRLRSNPLVPHLKVIMFSGRASPDEMAKVMLDGADDYMTKPFSITQLQARVRAALRLKNALERSELLNRHLLEANNDLERSLSARTDDLAAARNALAAALSGVALLRSPETGGHQRRMRRYCRRLAEEAARSAPFAGQLDANFIEVLESCSAIHDIGNAGLPDHILMKSSRFTTEERFVMQTHAALGADMLRALALDLGFAPEFFQMAIDVTRHHHERYDGRGYPDKLSGEAIPLSARIVAIADVYDALRSRRVHRPALPHDVAYQIVTEQSSGQFDPALIELFNLCAANLDRTFNEIAD